MHSILILIALGAMVFIPALIWMLTDSAPSDAWRER